MIQKGWNLVRDEWRKLGDLIGDAEWKYVPFNRSHINGVPTRPGVYLIVGPPPGLSEKPHNRLLTVLYVGESESSIRTRFTTHCNAPQPSIQDIHRCYSGLMDDLSFYYTELPADHVKAAESVLIDCYGPPANRKDGELKAKLKGPVTAG